MCKIALLPKTRGRWLEKKDAAAVRETHQKKTTANKKQTRFDGHTLRSLLAKRHIHRNIIKAKNHRSLCGRGHTSSPPHTFCSTPSTMRNSLSSRRVSSCSANAFHSIGWTSLFMRKRSLGVLCGVGLCCVGVVGKGSAKIWRKLRAALGATPRLC